jgi:hypothetical protein
MVGESRIERMMKEVRAVLIGCSTLPNKDQAG